ADARDRAPGVEVRADGAAFGSELDLGTGGGSVFVADGLTLFSGAAGSTGGGTSTVSRRGAGGAAAGRGWGTGPADRARAVDGDRTGDRTKRNTTTAAAAAAETATMAAV